MHSKSATQVIISALRGDADNKVGEQRVFSALIDDADNKVDYKQRVFLCVEW